MGKKKLKSRRKKSPRHEVSEGEGNFASGSRDESTSNVQNVSLGEQNDLCLTQSRHDASMCEGNSEEEQDTDSSSSGYYVTEDFLKMAEVLLEGYLQIMTEPTREVNNVVYDTDESTDEEHITMDQVLDLTHAQSEKICEGEAALEQLKSRVTEQKKEITKLENMSKMDSKALKHLRKSTKALEEQKSELQSRLRSLEEEKEKLIAKVKVIADLQEEIWALQQDTDSATRRIQNLTDELENMTKLKEDQEDSRKCENAEHKSEKNKLNQRLWGVEKQKKKLELDKVEANAKIEQLSMNNQQVKEEILRMALKMSVNEDISEKLKKAEEELDDLKRDMKLKGE